MIAIASDHGGYALKEHIKAYLAAKGITCQDFGCETPDRCDYPVFGKAAAQAVASGQCEKGIVICTTGIGISISANKVKGIRCALCGDTLVRRDVPPPQQCQHAGYGGGYRGPQPGGADGGRVSVPPNSTAAPYQAGRADDGDRGLSPAEKCSGEKKGIDKQLPVR